jgi:hypothetical protein
MLTSKQVAGINKLLLQKTKEHTEGLGPQKKQANTGSENTI